MSKKLTYSLISGLVIVIAVALWVQFSEKDVAKPVVNQQVAKPASRLVHLLPEELTKGEYNALLTELDDHVRSKEQFSSKDLLDVVAYLKQQPKGFGSEQWHEYTNSLFRLLQVQSKPSLSTPVTDLLLALAEESDDVAIRLYAVQHYRGWYRNNASAVDQQRLKDSLILLLQRQEAGTALKVLSDLKIEAADINERALKIAADDSKAVDVRISALHVSCERSNASILPLTRTLAQSEGNHMQLRKAAVFCIGEFGDSTDLPVLSTLSNENARLKKAAQLAQQKITNR